MCIHCTYTFCNSCELRNFACLNVRNFYALLSCDDADCTCPAFFTSLGLEVFTLIYILWLNQCFSYILMVRLHLEYDMMLSWGMVTSLPVATSTVTRNKILLKFKNLHYNYGLNDKWRLEFNSDYWELVSSLNLSLEGVNGALTGVGVVTSPPWF